jgi:DNA-binding transcriptional LysR family regulator
LDLSLAEAEPAAALRMLRAGYVDVALIFRHYQQDADQGPPSGDDEGTRGTLLLDEPVHLVTPAGWGGGAAGPAAGPAADPAAGRDAPDLAGYAGHRWIAGCDRCRAQLIRQCAPAGFAPKVAFTTDDYVAVQALVAAGLDVTTLPALALRAARHPGIDATPLPGARR